jgi:hypothetical protein
MGSASHAVSLKATGAGCCTTIQVGGCDAAKIRRFALVSASTRIEPLQRISSHPSPACGISAGSTAKQGPAQGLYRSALLARPTPPVYLLANVFLC